MSKLPPGIIPKYDPDVYPAYRTEYDEFALKMAERGATNKELAEFFNIPRGLFDQWVFQYESFARSIKVGKELADDRVVSKLYELAVSDNTHTLGAIKMWLTNRRRNEWSERAVQEISVGGAPIEMITRIEFVGVPAEPVPADDASEP